jgi:hypothetical protein
MLTAIARARDEVEFSVTSEWSSPKQAESTCAVPHPGLVCEAIARLSDGELMRMSSQELVHLIQASPVMAREADGFNRLSWMHDRELRRIASLVRRCCRTRVNAFQRARGQQVEWYDAC